MKLNCRIMFHSNVYDWRIECIKRWDVSLGMTSSMSVLWLWCMTYIFPNRHLIIKQYFKSNLSTKKWTIFLLDNYNFLGIEILISDWIKFIWSDLPNTRHVLQNSTRHKFRNFTVYDNKCFANLPQQKLRLTKFIIQRIGF